MNNFSLLCFSVIGNNSPAYIEYFSKHKKELSIKFVFKKNIKIYRYLNRNRYFSTLNQYTLYVDTRIFYPYKLLVVAENLSVTCLRIIY